MTNVLSPGDVASDILSLEDYLNYDDGTDTRYELEDGKLRVMPTESDRNQRIASFLFVYFAQLGIPFYRLRIGVEVAVSGVRTTVRLPDLTILTEELAQALAGASRSLVTLDMPPPQLVVEVVSPGADNENRDYRYKRSQYQARGISEYWIVDPMQGRITVLTLVDGLYEEAVFEGVRAIVSALCDEFEQGSPLTAARVFDAGSH